MRLELILNDFLFSSAYFAGFFHVRKLIKKNNSRIWIDN